MNISKLYKGQIIKNYKHLCETLEIEIKDGTNSKNAQFKELARYVDFERIGHKIIINDIYKIPLPKIEKRGGSNNTKYDRLNITHPSLIDEWDAEKNNLSPNDVTMCSIYEAWWKCAECGYEWQTTVEVRAYGGKGCPVCSGSKGERKISSFLKKYEVKFKVQYKFDDLKGINNGVLRFDFVVFNKDKTINCLIEYDGQHHFKVVNGEIEKHKSTIEHDKRKNEYCKTNDIKLIRIPYTYYNIMEELLADEFNIEDFEVNIIKKSKKDIIAYYEWKLSKLQ